MSIKLMTMAFNAYVNNPVRKLILIKLCDNANDDGVCWPSYARIADQCEVSKRCAMEHIKWLSDNGFLEVESRFKDGNQSSNCYTISVYKLMQSSTNRGENNSLPSEPCSPPLVNVVHPPSEPCSPRIIIESPERTDNVIPIKKSRAKKQEMTFPEWAENERAAGKKLIDDTDPIFDHTEKTGVPFEFLMVAWFAFKDQYTNDNLKKQKDWRQYFRNAIKGDWMKIWAFNQAGECYLTTKGKQYQNAMGRTA